MIPAPLPISTCRSFLVQNVLYVSFCRIAVADVIKQLHLLGTDSSHLPLTDYNLPLTTSFHGTFQAEYKRSFYNGHPAPPPLWTDRNFLVQNVFCVSFSAGRFDRRWRQLQFVSRDSSSEMMTRKPKSLFCGLSRA